MSEKPEITAHSDELLKMIADYMENGFLENIIDMFLHDRSLYSLVGDLIRDERVRVRIGTTALIEELRRLDPDHITAAVPSLLPLLAGVEPIVKGDAANLLGIIGDPSALPFLEKMAGDPHEGLRAVVNEAIGDIHARQNRRNPYQEA